MSDEERRKFLRELEERTTPHSWGIYRGYVPYSNPLQRWHEPECDHCSKILQPWIDWHSHGCIGYCTGCNDFKIVKSCWEPVPEIHPRAELERLVSHSVESLGLSSVGFDDSAQLWRLHKLVPLDQETAYSVDQARRRHRGGEEALVVLEHMYWSLIWNSDGDFPELVQEYLEFTFEHPHCVRFRSCDVWVGHELNLVEALEERYPNEIVDKLFEIYQGTNLSSEEFKRRLGFYIPRTDKLIQKFGRRFFKYARQARVRPRPLNHR